VTITLAVDVLGCRPRTGQAEVGNLQSTLKVDEDVGRLEVEMDVSRVVDERQALLLG
jgi:hypothetical protein